MEKFKDFPYGKPFVPEDNSGVYVKIPSCEVTVTAKWYRRASGTHTANAIRIEGEIRKNGVRVITDGSLFCYFTNFDDDALVRAASISERYPGSV